MVRLLRPALAAAALLGALVLIAVGYWRIQPAQAELAEREWIKAHAPVASYRVRELGLQGPDGSARSVWVRVPGHADAFVHLDGSRLKITRVGQQVSAMIDVREDPYDGEGYVPDNVSRSKVRVYVTAGWPIGVAAALIAAVVLGARRSRGSAGRP